MEGTQNDTALAILALAISVVILVGILFIHIYDPGLNNLFYTMRQNVLAMFETHATSSDPMP